MRCFCVVKILPICKGAKIWKNILIYFNATTPSNIIWWYFYKIFLKYLLHGHVLKQYTFFHIFLHFFNICVDTFYFWHKDLFWFWINILRHLLGGWQVMAWVARAAWWWPWPCCLVNIGGLQQQLGMIEPYPWYPYSLPVLFVQFPRVIVLTSRIRFTICFRVAPENSLNCKLTSV